MTTKSDPAFDGEAAERLRDRQRLKAKASGFLAALDRLIAGARASDQLVALLVVQIDGLNRINTTVGHTAGAQLQSNYEASLREAVPDGAVVRRVADRKFAVVLVGLDDERDVSRHAELILEQARPRLSVGENELVVDAVMGIALCPAHAEIADELLRRAELGLATALTSGSSYEFYHPDSTVQVASMWLLESDLEAAVKAGDLELHYQPKFSIPDGDPIGIEALMRWSTSSRGAVPAEVFMGVAERTGLVKPMTWFGLNEVAKHAEEWSAPLTVALNVSALLLEDPEFIERVTAANDQLASSSIELLIEITESAFMDDPDACLKTLYRIRDAGIQISIDDFGTGFSSLTYLKEIPAKELKIDQSFVQGMLKNPADLHIVRSVIDLAHGFGMTVAAEGVEDQKTLVKLAELGCDSAQGYHLAPPLPQEELVAWLATVGEKRPSSGRSAKRNTKKKTQTRKKKRTTNTSR